MPSKKNTGKNNPNYSNGNRIKANYPCPQCKKDMWREGRRKEIICIECHNKNRKEKAIGHKKVYKKHYNKNKEKIIKKQLEYYHKNKEEILIKRKKWRKENPDRVKKWKKYTPTEEQKEITREKQRTPKYRKRVNKYVRKRKKINPEFATQMRLRRLVLQAFTKYTKEGKIWKSSKYGIDYQAIIEYLKPFPENLSDYHIDHIKPLCSFSFINSDGSTNNEEIKKAFAPENHQWLTAKENLVKNRFY